MATWILSECGLKPLAPVIPRPRTGAALSSTSRVEFLDTNKVVAGPKFQPLRCNLRERNWGLKVSAPLRVASIEEEQKSVDLTNGTNGVEHEKLPEFDPGAPPPFNLADIRAAIPKHCWVKDPWRSMSYVVRDVIAVFGLAAAAAYLNNWLVWPLYWAAQGTMFWALFVLGHDCGHGSFSNNSKLNSVVGHLLHSSILVPYHGWRISHRTHHQHHGHAENDESWHPLPEKLFRSLDTVTRMLRFTAPFPLLAFPVYLFSRSPGKTGSHFDPSSDLFVPNERKDVITSTACWAAMLGLLVGLGFVMGPIQLLKLYGVPYVVSFFLFSIISMVLFESRMNEVLI
ncbi:hypothetical protein GLYMA_18G202600v4 [Glycine max]|uniref:Omega-3 fatty acid desaturase n=1 Tax=Glycine max TaxID=3847 RepID=I1N2Y7_SOYBN|nr:hypothetical protein GLYMA_18G202600v4 [Glycine max]